jgi:hypothetical protein
VRDIFNGQQGRAGMKVTTDDDVMDPTSEREIRGAALLPGSRGFPTLSEEKLD